MAAEVMMAKGKTMAKNQKKPDKPMIPKQMPLELSPSYRIVYSERQFTRIDGDNLVISFLSRDRRFTGSKVDATPDGQGFVPAGPTDETDVEIEEVTIKLPILRAIELSELNAINVRNLSPERLKELGIQIT